MSASSFQTEPAAVRADHDTLMIDITLDDPKAYTMPLHTQKKFILKPDWNLMEFVCEDNLLNFRDYEKKGGYPQEDQIAGNQRIYSSLHAFITNASWISLSVVGVSVRKTFRREAGFGSTGFSL